MADELESNGELTVAFPCDLCEKPAATITLASDGTIVVVALIGRTTMRIRTEQMVRVRDILFRRDARALYALDHEWGSFYCPECDRSYCADHWHFDVRYDDEFPGWYDRTYGTCPDNHTRLVDD
jgi:hypothetical protein